MSIECINIWAVIIPGSATICSIIATVIIALIRHKEVKLQISLNMITAKRIEWQETMRNELANFIQDCNELMHLTFISHKEKSSDLKPMSSKVSKILADGYRIILRLNPSKDKKVIDTIEEIMTCNYYDYESIEITTTKLDILRSKLIKEAQAMINKEQGKIEAEAGYKR